MKTFQSCNKIGRIDLDIFFSQSPLVITELFIRTKDIFFLTSLSTTKDISQWNEIKNSQSTKGLFIYEMYFAIDNLAGHEFN